MSGRELSSVSEALKKKKSNSDPRIPNPRIRRQICDSLQQKGEKAAVLSGRAAVRPAVDL